MVDQDSSSNAEYLIGQLNVTNAKKVAVLMVLGFMCYHGLIHLRYGKYFGIDQYFSLLCTFVLNILFNKGSDSCKWLLSAGRFKGDREWQPYGCMMHKYTQT